MTEPEMEMDTLCEGDIVTALHELLEFATNEGDLLGDCEMAQQVAGGIDSVVDFRRAGVLTSNEGFVLTLADGSEFQVSVIQSRVAR